jgi:hypothetical protein
MHCYNCGGWRHASRNCPSERKSGKGGKDGGRGKGNPAEAGKGKGRGAGRGDKGKGKGFQGICFKRGKPGHRAWECRSRPIGANAVEEEEDRGDDGVEVGAVEIGAVWNIGAVEFKQSPNTMYRTDVPNPKTRSAELTGRE